MPSTTLTIFIVRAAPRSSTPRLGGGAIFNQGSHQVDIVRLIGGGRIETCARQPAPGMEARPTEGAYAALLTFANGAFASLTYSGYGNFDSDEFQGWIGKWGRRSHLMPVRHGVVSTMSETKSHSKTHATMEVLNSTHPQCRISRTRISAHCW